MLRSTARPLAFIAVVAGFSIATVSAGSDDAGEPLVDSSRTLTSVSFFGAFDDELTKPGSDAARYVILRDDLATGVPDIAAVRAANPGAQILLAKNAAFTIWDEEGEGTDRFGDPRCSFAPFQGTGVDYCEADEQEEWFLHADDGERMRSIDYSAQWAMDPADPGYQRAWTESVLERLRDADRDGDLGEGLGDRYDGVWMDDVNVHPGHGLAQRGIAGMAPAIPGAPAGDVPAYREGMVGFIDEVSNEIREQPEAFVTMANVEGDIFDPAQRTAALQIAGDLDVYNQERFFRLYFEDRDERITGDLVYSDPGTTEAPSWSDWIEFMGEVQATGASYSGITYGRDSGPRDERSQRFARASFLIGWDGTDGGALAYRSLDDSLGGPLRLPGWTTSVGVPSGEAYAVGDAWRRDFSTGTVIVNPALEGVASLALGESHRLPDGTCTAMVEVPAGDALVLPSCG